MVGLGVVVDDGVEDEETVDIFDEVCVGVCVSLDVDDNVLVLEGVGVPEDVCVGVLEAVGV